MGTSVAEQTRQRFEEIYNATQGGPHRVFIDLAKRLAPALRPESMVATQMVVMLVSSASDPCPMRFSAWAQL